MRVLEGRTVGLRGWQPELPPLNSVVERRAVFVAHSEGIFQAIVVVVPEPGWERHVRQLPSRPCCYLLEAPRTDGLPDAIHVQPIRRAVHGHEQVGKAIVVDVAPRAALYESVHVDAHFVRHFREGAVAIAEIQLGGMRAPPHRDTGLVADEQVEAAVEVEVAPCGGVPRMHRTESRLERHVLEGSIAAVVKQRHGKLAAVAEPGAAENQDVLEAVVVVVGMQTVGAANDPVKSRLPGAVDVPAMSVRHEKVDGILESPRRRKEIEQAVATEILDAESASLTGDVRADAPRDIRKVWE